MATRNSTRRASSAAPAKAAPSTSFRGAAGLRRMKEEEKKAEVRKAAAQASMKEPFRFFVRPGESATIIIVDEAPDFFRMEHALMNPRTKRYNLFVPCLDEHTNCPACAVSDKPAYFAMYLTVIDLTPYEKDGHEVEWSKKMMVVKATQQKKIMRLYEKHGTLRGMELVMTRDGEMDAAIGNDIEFQGFVPEEELQDYITEYTDREKKVHEVIGDEPFDYEDIYPDMGEDEVAALVGGRSSSRDDDDDEPAPRRSASRRGRGSYDEEAEEEETPRRASRRASRARDDEEEEEEEAPRRPARAGSRSAAPVRASRRAAVEEEEEAEEEEEEAPRRPARSARRGAPVEEEEAPQRPARRAARRAEVEVEDEEEEEEAPPATSRSSKRASLRPTRRR